ncbi:bacillithiol biosynthesis cysteine-adding enzyme BshC [Oceanobacillus sp. FSL W7-1304]|uniref:bacillithiol biosynthesis cysteine-adding enzyme BshC n=1 Tax=Oceanobacillus sp. FSL W7-1304 TaxID=2975322 RepID=UPI0030DB5432
MRINPIQLKTQSQLITDYRNNAGTIMDFFDYLPHDNYYQRVRDLHERTFERKHLTDVLFTMNKEWGAPASTLNNIERLKETDSVVVIGGQQAGLLTGPMYTINKIVSIIQLAGQQEEKLGIPVIPVFWIAGEDHDFEEINHVYLPDANNMKKYKIRHRLMDKRSVSNISINRSALVEWVDELFEQLKETKFTKRIYATIHEAIELSDTYTDFFARVIFHLFNEDGLVVVDSGSAKTRQLETEHFKKMIRHQEEISLEVFNVSERLAKDGYAISLELSEAVGHLFYHKDQERILLFRNDEGEWVGKQNEVCFQTNELISIAENYPERLSNNVVTRPLMQELLFPTLAFVGGPGEIGYWAALQPAFHALNIKMPPVVPRLSFTIVEDKVKKALEKFDIDIADAINKGVRVTKEKWLQSKSNPPVEDLSIQMKEVIETAHQPLRKLAKSIRADIGDLSEKNLEYLYRDIDFLTERIVKVLEEKYEKELRTFDEIERTLHPQGGLQERVWNPLPWINTYGIEFISELTYRPYDFEKGHYIIYI